MCPVSADKTISPTTGEPVSTSRDAMGAPIVTPRSEQPIGHSKLPVYSQERSEIMRADFIKHAAGKGATPEEQARLDAISAENFDNAMRAEGLAPPDPADQLHPDDLKLMAQLRVAGQNSLIDFEK